MVSVHNNVEKGVGMGEIQFLNFFCEINGVYGNGLKRYSQLPAQIGGEGCKPLQRLMFVVAYHVSDSVSPFSFTCRMRTAGKDQKNENKRDE